MKKLPIILVLVTILIVALPLYLYQNNKVQDTKITTPTEQPSEQPADEQAETVGFNFIQNFIKSGPPQPDSQAMQDAYNALSVNAKTKVSPDSISRDLAAFVGVQDIPDLGASVEDLQIISDTQSTLIVGLNFSGGRVFRSINLIKEEGSWKVDGIDSLEQYP